MYDEIMLTKGKVFHIIIMDNYSTQRITAEMLQPASRAGQ